MKTLKLNAIVGSQMDDEDGSSLGVLLDTDDGEYMLLAEPEIMTLAAEKCIKLPEPLNLCGNQARRHLSLPYPNRRGEGCTASRLCGSFWFS